VNSGIRRVGIAMIVLFVGLVAQLTYLQVARSNELSNDPRNSRQFLRDLRRPRGPIVSGDGVVLARSIPSDDEFEQQRVYPPETANLFAHIVGYQSIQFGSVGVEKTYSNSLSGRDIRTITGNLADAFSGRDVVGTVTLTTTLKAQQAAAAALGTHRGSVVVLDTSTGGIVAAYSNPTFNPNPLASHNVKEAQVARTFLLADPTNPMLARSWRELYPPGSTFKTVTTGITVEDDVDVDKVFPELRELPLPLTNRTLKNFGSPPELCGGTLLESFVHSCNTTFGQVGLDLADRFAEGLPRFLVNTDPPKNDLDPAMVRSNGPKPGTFATEAPLFAQAAIGQGTVAVTPLEMALVAESVATGGVILEPHVLDHVEDPDGRVVRRYATREAGRAMSPETAATVRDFMIQVVERGTGTAAQIPGVQVAGKTGTAQTIEGEAPHAWFIAFAPADQPRYAISVLVEHGGDVGSEATGGRVAAPIAKQVLEALLAG
jgi:peptidoglycan glycosyltransferase